MVALSLLFRDRCGRIVIMSNTVNSSALIIETFSTYTLFGRISKVLQPSIVNSNHVSSHKCSVVFGLITRTTCTNRQLFPCPFNCLNGRILGTGSSVTIGRLISCLHLPQRVGVFVWTPTQQFTSSSPSPLSSSPSLIDLPLIGQTAIIR